MEEEMLELIWTNHGPIFSYWFTEHREKERYTDATIGCEGKLYAVHKLVLATCSDYFGEVFEHTEGKHPVLLLHDVKQHELEAILCYMYTGSANVSQLNLSRFMNVAKNLQIKGLAVPDGNLNDRLATTQNPPVDRAKRPSSGRYGWQENHHSSSHSMTDLSEIHDGSDVDDRDVGNVTVDVKIEDDKMATKLDGKETANQYSFQGFSYKNVEGPDDEDLIKKREVLEKIISQTEKDFVREEDKQDKPGPLIKSEEYDQMDNFPDLNLENEDNDFDQKKTMRKDKQTLPSGSSKYLKGNGKKNLMGHKKSSIGKLKATSVFKGMKKHIHSHSRVKSYKCPQCSASFSRKYTLRRHMETHVDVEKFVCSYCHANFANQEFLTNHLETHDKNKPYLCTLCRASFSRRDKLTVHIKNHELEDKSSKLSSNSKDVSGSVYVCEECPATFENHGQFVEHSQMHAGEKQFPCTVCPAAFAKKVHLSRHVLTHKGFGSRDKLQDCL